MLDIDAVLTSLAGAASQVEAYRRASRPETVALPQGMAALMGKASRQRIPFLGVAIEAVSNKLFTRRISAGKATLDKALARFLEANQWELLERDLWEAALRDGYSFLLVTFGAEGPKLTLRPAYNGSEGAAQLPDGATINVYTLDEVKCADLFYPDRIEKYQIEARTGQWVPRRDTEAEPWPLPWVDNAGAPLGLALIPFGNGASMVADALQVQSDLNEALLDMGAVSRSQGWPQRYLSGETSGGLLRNIHGQPVRDALGNPVRKEMRLEPGSVLRLEGDAAKLGQLDAARVDRTAVDVHLEVLSLVTGVPSHYFTGDWPSGVALLRAETRINARAEHLQSVFTPSLVAALRLMFSLEALYGAGGAVPEAISVEWYPPQVEDEAIRAERASSVMDLYKAGLISLEVAIARLNPDWTPEEVAEEVERLRRERSNAATQTVPLSSEADAPKGDDDAQ